MVFGLLLGLASGAAAEVVNVDINGTAGDATYSGADGVLSTTGSTWNGVLAGTDATGLLDENGVATGVSFSWPNGAFGDSNPSATNVLQDSGTFDGFELGGLVSGQSYDIAVYMDGGFFDFTDSTGTAFQGTCASGPTFALPGTAGLDYCLFSDVLPADLGGGNFGFVFTGADGVYYGVQLATEGGGGGPDAVAVPALPPLLAVLALLGVGGVARQVLRRR